MVEEQRVPEGDVEPVARSAEGIETVDDVVETVPESVEDEPEDEEPITVEEFSEAMAELGKRAKRAGLRPFTLMMSNYATQVVGAIDSLFSSFENTGKKKKGK